MNIQKYDINKVKFNHRLLGHALEILRISKEGNIPENLKIAVLDAENYLKHAITKFEDEIQQHD